MASLWRALVLALLVGPGAVAQPLASSAAAPVADVSVQDVLARGDWHRATARLYEERDHERAWTLAGDARRLMERIEASGADGLDPASLHLQALTDARGAERDVLLTDAALRLADALAGRRVDPEEVHEGHWYLTRDGRRRRRTDTEALVGRALDAPDPASALLASLDALQPQHPEYYALRQRLGSLLSRDLPVLTPAPVRSTDASGDIISGEIPVVHRQRPDPAEIARLRLNLERWRWLPDDFGDEHILVNVPGTRLWLREDGGRSIALDMEATIGQPEPQWQTPVLSDPIRTVAFFPTWTPTITIQREEIIPQAREDGGQRLYDLGFDVFRGRQKLDPRRVNWDRARAGQYRIVQRGGPNGALGRVKFVMPNRHWILIHDTNTPEEFDGDERALSHGCVRAEDPEALADAILTRTNGWASDRASGLLRGAPRSRGVRLSEQFPVHIVYFTAWPLADGSIAYHDDVYGRDAELADALGLALPPLAE